MEITNKNFKYFEYSAETADKYKIVDWFASSIGLMFFSGALSLEFIISDFLLYYNKFPNEVRLKITTINIWVIVSIFLICCIFALVKGSISLNKRYMVYALDSSNTMYQYNFSRHSRTSNISRKLENSLYDGVIAYTNLKKSTEKVNTVKSVIKFDEIISCIVKKKYIILTANVSKINRFGHVKQYKYKKKIYMQYEDIENLIEVILLVTKKGEV